MSTPHLHLPAFSLGRPRRRSTFDLVEAVPEAELLDIDDLDLPGAASLDGVALAATVVGAATVLLSAYGAAILWFQ